MTVQQLATELGRGEDAVRKRFEKAFGKSRPWKRTMIFTPEEVAAIRNAVVEKKSEATMNGKKFVKQPIDTAEPKEVSPVKTWFKFPKVSKSDWQRVGLLTLMAVPATASIQNMHTVTGHLTESVFASLTLTALFSASPFLFVLVGAKSIPARILVILMIGYEGFCNTMRIYGGLTRFGIDGYPTRFLGLVTDFFDSGTYQTARVLAVFMASLAACIFYAAYMQLNKSK